MSTDVTNTPAENVNNATNATVRARVAKTQRRFLERYAATGRVVESARAAGVHRATHYRWLREDPSYEERFSEAHDEWIESLEREAWRRAVEGVEKPVGWYKGVSGGTVREYSDQLLIKLLEAHAPEKYSQRYVHELQGLLRTINELIAIDELTHAQLDALSRRVPLWQVFSSPRDIPLLPPSPGEERPILPEYWPIPEI